MKYEELISELKHKERTIKDLIAYIDTRSSEQSPNYSLLLGAGASRSSGIKTGSELVNEWRQEVYQRLSGEQTYDEETAKNYFLTNGGAWYSLANEYSSLFEKKFDLASQRRRFVEQEVDNKLPSIGYSYLVSLTNGNNRYFDTIFTTNFDDLINESFHQFSQIRPIVCAHDSSVNSISISSTRPKIIKLHGDYLFDDIKSTLRETESLESNIKNKLIEFSKEYGLIVSGYAGNDRSIMDVINHLLKTDEYLKNGIYWCLREDDDINPELRKLLWKDRVYFVKVDGFDEFMAEIHNGLKGELSLKDNFTDSKKDAIVGFFTKDDYSLCDNSEIIKSDIDNLKKHKNDQDISNLIRELSEESYSGNTKADNDRISENDLKNLLIIDSLVKSKNLSSAKEQAEIHMSACNNIGIKTKYIKKLISINNRLELHDAAIELCDKLISVDEYNASHAITKAVNLKKLSKRCEYISSVVSKYESSYYFHNFLARTGISEYQNTNNEPAFTLDFMIKETDKSLTLNPGLSNPAWMIKLDILKQKFELTPDKQTQSQKKEIKEKMLSDAEKINRDHLAFFKIRNHKFVRDEKYSTSIKTIEDLLSLYEKSNNKKRRDILGLICDICLGLDSLEHNENHKNFINTFLESEIIKSFNEPESLTALTILKSKHCFVTEHNLQKSLKNIGYAMQAEDSHEYLGFIITMLCDISGDHKKAEDFLESVEENISKQSYLYAKSNIQMLKGNHEEAILSIEKAYEQGLSFDEYAARKIYILIVSEQYDSAISFSELNFEKVKSKDTKDIFTINTSLAQKKLNKKIDKVAVRNVISHGFSKDLIICAECILGHEVIAKRLLKESIENNQMNYYSYKEWPAIPNEYLETYNKSNSQFIEPQLKCVTKMD